MLSEQGNEGASDADRSAEFMDLITPNQSRLFGYIFALVQHADDAHDLYQQTVMALWRKFDDFEPGTNFVAWAMRTAQLEVLTYQRSRRRSRVRFSEVLVSQFADIESERSKNDTAEARYEALIQCLEKLHERDHRLVEVCYQRGNKIKQVAAQLGRSSQSICNSLRRIRVALLKCVDRTLAQEGEA